MRKLLHIAAGYGAALIFAHYLLPHKLLPILAAIALVLSLAAFLFRKTLRARLLLIIIPLSAGLFWSWAHTELFVYKTDALSGLEMTISAIVLDHPQVYDSYSSVLLRLDEGGLPHSKIQVYSYDYDLASMKPGEHISLPLKFYSALKRYDIEIDSYSSKGVYGCAYVIGEHETYGEVNRLIYLQKFVALEFKKAVYNAFTEDMSPFIAALLTGDKTRLYENEELYFALGSAGLTHIVAVSGMHLSFLTGFCRMATGRRRRTAFVCVPIIIAFMALVGFTPSVVRAGIMQIIVLSAPLLRRESDPVTSLAFAFLFLTANPQTIASVSLQLSFAATAGIVLITPGIYKAITQGINDKNHIAQLCLRGVVDVFACSVGALVFTVPLCALHFGYVALYSIISNLLCLWALTATFLLSFIIALFSLICLPAGAFLAGIISWMPRAVFEVVYFIADLPYARLYTSNNYFAWWLVFVYAIFISTYLAKGKSNYRPIIPLCSCIASFAVISVLNTLGNNNRITVAAIDVGQGQAIAAISEYSTVVIDCGSTNTRSDSGELTAKYLFSYGREKVDLLILTHLHSDHASGVKTLLNLIDVDAIALPSSDSANSYHAEIVALAQSKDIELYYITENAIAAFTDISYTLFAPLGKTNVNENGIIILGDYGEFEFLVTGDIGTSNENILCLTHDLPDIELLVVGHHGSKYSTGEKLLTETTPDTAFISVGYNSYGHPSDEVMQRLESCGAEIYRTDLNGNISITVGKEDG